MFIYYGDVAFLAASLIKKKIICYRLTYQLSPNFTKAFLSPQSSSTYQRNEYTWASRKDNKIN